MQEILQELNQLGGVNGSLVITTDGRVLAHALSKGFESAQLELVARSVSQTFNSPNALAHNLTEFDLQFAQGRISARRLQNGFLLILCVPTINTTLLNLRANTAMKKLDSLAQPETMQADSHKRRMPPPETMEGSPVPSLRPRIRFLDSRKDKLR